jgi:antitoxin component YwqK of YwqJK toxin-antitoxin module
MKQLIGILFLSLCIFSCKNNSGQSADTVIQRDTLKSGNSFPVSKPDSIISNGEFIQYYKNGVTKMRGIMKNGKREGLWKSFYEIGAPWSETTFKDGKKDGKTATWYENEKKRYEGFYTNDAESGKWIYWDESGKKVTEKTY